MTQHESKTDVGTGTIPPSWLQAFSAQFGNLYFEYVAPEGNVSYIACTEDLKLFIMEIEKEAEARGAYNSKTYTTEETIACLCREADATSKAHGWKHENDGQDIALMHSELSEALEALRKPGKQDEHLPALNPVGLELADVLIRVFDFCGAKGIDLAGCVTAKMAYNKTRPYKHGGKKF